MTGRLGRGREERGNALVIAIIVMAIMLTTGLAVVAASDVQQRQGGVSRLRESSFNLAEGALYAQGFLLPQGWPGTAADAYPASCSSAVGTTPKCPDHSTLAAAGSSSPGAANFNTQDFTAAQGSACPDGNAADPQLTCWVTAVRDNVRNATGAEIPFAWSVGKNWPTWDANGDKQVWVYARAFVHGQPRAVVAKLKLEKLHEALSSAGLRTGHFRTGNNGNQLIVDARGSQVLVNCDPGTTHNNSCASYKSGQVTPDATRNPGPSSLMTPAQLARFKARAIADGTYYAGCPSDFSGKVVWIENCSAKITSSTPTVRCNVPNTNGNSAGSCINTPVGQTGGCATQSCPGILGGPGPGLLIWHHGTLSGAGRVTFVGTMYFPNGSDDGVNPSSGDVVSTSGGFGVFGSLAIDGAGGLSIGDNGLQFVYDPNSNGVYESYGTAGLVQNTWRELSSNGG